MNLSEFQLAVRDYVNDPHGDSYTDEELRRAINEAQLQVSVIGQELEPTIMHSVVKMNGPGTVGTVGDQRMAFEYFALPADFRKMIAMMRITDSSGTDLVAARVTSLVPLFQLGTYGQVSAVMVDDSGDVASVIYGTPPFSNLKEELYVEVDGTRIGSAGGSSEADFSRVKDRRSWLVFLLNAVGSRDYLIHYLSSADEMTLTSLNGSFLTEYDELVVVEAVLNLLRRSNAESTSTKALRDHLMSVMTDTISPRAQRAVAV